MARTYLHLPRLGVGLLRVAVPATWIVLGGLASAFAEELRVVESSGLSRAVKVVRGKATVVITLLSQSPDQSGASCTATNVDGIVADVTVAADANNKCVFDQLKNGTWRVSINPATLRWKAHIEEPT